MAVNTSMVNVLSYSATNVSSSAYVTLFASTPTSVSKLEILDSSGQIMKIALGSAGNEMDICTAPVSGTILLPYFLPIGSRLSIRAVATSASTGYSVVSLIP